MPSIAPIRKPARRPHRRIKRAAGSEASAVPTTIAAIGRVAQPGTGANTAPMMAPSAIAMTIADSISA